MECVSFMTALNHIRVMAIRMGCSLVAFLVILAGVAYAAALSLSSNVIKSEDDVVVLGSDSWMSCFACNFGCRSNMIALVSHI